MSESSEVPEEPAPDLGITPQDVSGEIRDFVSRQERRRRLVPRAALVGLCAGLLAIAFRLSIEGAEHLRTALYSAARTLGAWGFALPPLACALAAGLSLHLVRRFAPEAAGSGIPHLKAVLHRLRGLRSARLVPVKFASGLLAIGGGLALGREGPTVQMGGGAGHLIGGWLGVTPRERQALIAAGAGAGLAAAFNAPLAGVIFVLEELQGDFAPGVLTSSFVASLTADLVSRLALGQLPVFHLAAAPAPPLGSLPAFLLLGALAGLFGVLFNRSLLAGLRGFERLAGWPLGLPAALVGLSIGIAGWWLPGALGGGVSLLERAFVGEIAMAPLLALLALRFAMTILSYGSGVAGGIFAPLLVLGALLGQAVGLAAGRWGGSLSSAPGSTSAFPVVGMAALFAAIVRAPLTAIVLILEMTANYSLMLPLLAAAFIAYGVADLLGDRPIYQALLERDTLRGQDAPELAGTLLVERTVRPGAPFDGRRVADLQLPAGCLLITVERHGKSVVPDRDTVLQAGDRITAVVAPRAAEGHRLLLEGTAPHG